MQQTRAAPAGAEFWLGLLLLLASKDNRPLAEAAGDTTPDRMQRLLNTSAWSSVITMATSALAPRQNSLLPAKTPNLPATTGVAAQPDGSATQQPNGIIWGVRTRC